MKHTQQHSHPWLRTILIVCWASVCANTFAQSEQRCQGDNIVATTPDSRFQQHGNQTVTDTQTALMWSQCLLGTHGENCSTGAPLEFNWAEALLSVAEFNHTDRLAGYTDWRLPNIRELSTLAELQCSAPAINTRVFPSPARSHVWTSSPYHFYTHYSWYVDFSNGAATYDERIKPKMLRLVRDATTELAPAP